MSFCVIYNLNVEGSRRSLGELAGWGQQECGRKRTSSSQARKVGLTLEVKPVVSSGWECGTLSDTSSSVSVSDKPGERFSPRLPPGHPAVPASPILEGRRPG